MICTKIRNTFGVKQLPWRSGLAEELELLSLNGGKELTDEPTS